MSNSGDSDVGSRAPLLPQSDSQKTLLDVNDIEQFKKEQNTSDAVQLKAKSQAKYTKIESPIWYLMKILFVYALVLIDIFLNSSVNSDNYSNVAENDFWPFLFLVVQTSVQVFIFLTLFLLMCGTYLMRIGLPGVIIAEFKYLGIAQGIYLLLTMILGVMRIETPGSLDPRILWNSKGYTFVYTIQNLSAAIYYHQVLYSSFKLSHEKYYTRAVWGKLSATV